MTTPLMVRFACVLLFLLPLQWAFELGSLGDGPLFRLGAWVLLGWWLLLGLLRPAERRIQPMLFWGVFAFLGAAVVSLLLGETALILGWRKLFFLAGLWPLLWVWYDLLAAGRLGLLAKALVSGSVLSAIVGLTIFALQWFFGVPTMFRWLTQTFLPFFLGENLATMVGNYPSLLVNIGGETWLRVTAVFPDPHVAAFYYGMSLSLAIALLRATGEKRWAIASFLLLAADMLTFSRGGYLGLAALLLALLLFWSHERYQWGKRWGFGIAALGLVAASPEIMSRFWSIFTLADASAQERLVLWKSAWESWQLHPWFGVGLGQYAEWALPFQGETAPYYAHNLWLDIAAEMGGLGVFAFGIVMLMALSLAWRKAIGGDVWAQAALAALALYLTHSFFETSLFSTQVTALLTFFIALAALPSHKSMHRQPEIRVQ